MLKFICAFSVALLSLLAAWFFNDQNLKQLRSDFPKRVYENGTIKTPDDNAYLAPPINYYQRQQWKENNPGKQSYFLRTPGYGLFRFLLMKNTLIKNLHL